MSDNFEDLIDQYWDEESVNNKIEEDTKEEIEEHGVYVDSRFDSPFSITDEISINDFVNEYLDIKGNFKNFRHFELKTLNCPYVLGVANEYADLNPTFVKEKKYLLIVIDRNGNRGTYINPVLAREFFDYDEDKAKEKMHYQEHDMQNISKFFEDFMHAKTQYEAYLEFYNILKETKKIKKFQKIESYEKKLGDGKK